MRIVVQNVKSSFVKIDNKIVGKINRGFCVLVGFTHNDNENIVKIMADKLLSLRLFNDKNGKTNLSLKDVNGDILSISQFTLYANVKEGRRPSFIDAMKPMEATKLYDYFNTYIRSLGYIVETGVFGADMEVNIVNDGPFTTILDSEELVK